MKRICIIDGCDNDAAWWRKDSDFALCTKHIMGYAFENAYEQWKKEQVAKCSFCKKPHNEVSKLISNYSCFICNECIDLCKEILIEEGVNQEDKSQ